jgi:hypothetical protein
VQSYIECARHVFPAADLPAAHLRPQTFDHLPLADAGRERAALELFPLDTSPEEYAARFGHDFRRKGAPTLQQLRERYLAPAEIAAIEKRAREPF